MLSFFKKKILLLSKTTETRQGDVPTISVTMAPIMMNTPILRYHIPARVESGQRGCIVKATAPMTVREENGRREIGGGVWRERERKREREREREHTSTFYSSAQHTHNLIFYQLTPIRAVGAKQMLLHLIISPIIAAKQQNSIYGHNK